MTSRTIGLDTKKITISRNVKIDENFVSQRRQNFAEFKVERAILPLLQSDSQNDNRFHELSSDDNIYNNSYQRPKHVIRFDDRDKMILRPRKNKNIEENYT